MVFGRATGSDKLHLFIGLSAENIRRLQNKEPIRINEKSKGEMAKGVDIVITYGDDETAIAKELEAMGHIDSKTKIRSDPRLWKQ